jgi:hypothetical protein
LLRGEQAIPAMLERVRERFGMQDVALLHRDSDAPASADALDDTPGGGLIAAIELPIKPSQ